MTTAVCGAVAAAGLAVSAVALVPGAVGGERGPSPSASPSRSAARGAGAAARAVSAALAAAPVPSTAPASVAAPTRVVIPEIGVDSDLVRLGTQPDGTLQVPTTWTDAGWYSGGPAPGAVGAAVIAGHVDSRSGPAVFAQLARLVPGDRVQVQRADGTSVAFVVTRTEEVAKATFPTQDVYGPVPGPELRLITCGGAFDRASGHYLDNVLVFAREA